MYRRPHQACGTCGDCPAIAHCQRCSRALCIAHVPLGGECCAACEDLFRMRAPGASWRFAGYAVVGPVGWLLSGPLAETWQGKKVVWGAFASGLAVVDAAVIALGFGMVLSWLLPRWRARVARRRFVARR